MPNKGELRLSNKRGFQILQMHPTYCSYRNIDGIVPVVLTPLKPSRYRVFDELEKSAVENGCRKGYDPLFSIRVCIRHWRHSHPELVKRATSKSFDRSCKLLILFVYKELKWLVFLAVCTFCNYKKEFYWPCRVIRWSGVRSVWLAI